MSKAIIKLNSLKTWLELIEKLLKIEKIWRRKELKNDGKKQNENDFLKNI